MNTVLTKEFLDKFYEASTVAEITALCEEYGYSADLVIDAVEKGVKAHMMSTSNSRERMNEMIHYFLIQNNLTDE